MIEVLVNVFLLGVYLAGVIFWIGASCWDDELRWENVINALFWPALMIHVLVWRIRERRAAKAIESHRTVQVKDERCGACFTCTSENCEQRDQRETCDDYQCRPVIVLSGSSRFRVAFREWAARLALDEDAVVLPPTVWSKAIDDPETCKRLMAVHLSKIDLADELFVLDVGGHIGESTAFEIEYAKRAGCRVRYLSQEDPTWTEADAELKPLWEDSQEKEPSHAS